MDFLWIVEKRRVINVFNPHAQDGPWEFHAAYTTEKEAESSARMINRALTQEGRWRRFVDLLPVRDLWDAANVVLQKGLTDETSRELSSALNDADVYPT